MARDPHRPSRLRALVLNLAIGALSLALTLAALEGAARLWARHLAGGPGTVRDPLLQFDPNLGWSKPPGGQTVMQRGS